MLDAMVEKAIKGDTMAFRELMDRGWGRPLQAVDHTSKGEEIKGNSIFLVDFRDEADSK